MHEELMEQVVSEANATQAWLAVKRNRGAAGIDGMTTGELGTISGRIGRASAPNC
jgi:2-succinyl-5-enolpyruvyl-6-hydroxy-3-cyclohexene-1-carboxylate synthase